MPSSAFCSSGCGPPTEKQDGQHFSAPASSSRSLLEPPGCGPKLPPDGALGCPSPREPARLRGSRARPPQSCIGSSEKGLAQQNYCWPSTLFPSFTAKLENLRKWSAHTRCPCQGSCCQTMDLQLPAIDSCTAGLAHVQGRCNPSPRQTDCSWLKLRRRWQPSSQRLGFCTSICRPLPARDSNRKDVSNLNAAAKVVRTGS